jgi:uncharacterized membrane protein
MDGWTEIQLGSANNTVSNSGNVSFFVTALCFICIKMIILFLTSDRENLQISLSQDTHIKGHIQNISTLSNYKVIEMLWFLVAEIYLLIQSGVGQITAADASQ